MVERLVVDASVAVKWVLAEDGAEAAASLIERPLMAPDLLVVEAASVLCKRVWSGELGVDDARDCLRVLQESPVDLVPSGVILDAAMALSTTLRYPIYDCLYLALALGQGVRLVTADQRLIRVCARAPSLAECVVPLSEV